MPRLQRNRAFESLARRIPAIRALQRETQVVVRVGVTGVGLHDGKIAQSRVVEAFQRELDFAALVNERTGSAGADVVFEVSGGQAGVDLMTRLPRTRGRIVVVAIHGEAPKVDLFRFFWRELKLTGARVYEPIDFEHAIELAAAGALPLDRLITSVLPLDRMEDAMHQLERGGDCMKILISCAE